MMFTIPTTEPHAEFSEVMYALDMMKEVLASFYTNPKQDFLAEWARNTARAITREQDKVRA